MLDFLNRNAGAIQAMAAVAYVAATIVLVYVTARYVSLTGQLLSVQQAARRERASELHSVTLSIRRALHRYPISRDTAAAKMRDAAPFSDDQITRFETLAAQFSVAAGEAAANAAGALRWLSRKVLEINAISPTLGYEWEAFPGSKWEEEMARANENVSAVWGAVTAGVAVTTGD